MSGGSRFTSTRDRERAQHNLCQWRRQAFLYRTLTSGHKCLLKTANIVRHALQEVQLKAEAGSASACCLGVIAATTTTKRHQRSYPLTIFPIKLAVRLRNASYVVSTVRWSQRGGLLRRRHVPMGHQRSLRVFDGRIFSRELRYVYLGAHSRPWLSRGKLLFLSTHALTPG